jgi:hypothetical protein
MDKRMLRGFEYIVLDPSGSIEGLSNSDLANIYNDFKAFAIKEILSGDVLKGITYGQQLKTIESELKSAGLSKTAREVSRVEREVLEEFIRDLDSPPHRKLIQEDVIFALASRALPDRLLLDRTVRNDPQVQKALQIVNSPEAYYSLLFK